MRPCFCVLLVATMALCACREKKLAVVNKYRPQYEPLIKEFAGLAQIPAPTGDKPLEKPLEPKAVGKVRHLKSNTLVIWDEHLKDIRVPSYKLDFYFPTTYRLDDAISEINMGDDILNIAKATPALSATLDWPFNLRYIAVMHMDEHVPPAFVEPKPEVNGYIPGRIKGRVWLIDRTTKAVLCSGGFEVASSEQVSSWQSKSTAGEPGDPRWRESIMSMLKNDLGEKLRETVLARLATITGGEFGSESDLVQ